MPQLRKRKTKEKEPEKIGKKGMQKELDNAPFKTSIKIMPRLRKRKNEEKKSEEIEIKKKPTEPDKIISHVVKQKESVEPEPLSKEKGRESVVKRKKNENESCSDEESNTKLSKTKKTAVSKTPNRNKDLKIKKEEDVPLEAYVKIERIHTGNLSLQNSPDSGISSEASSLTDSAFDDESIIEKTEPSTSSAGSKLVHDNSSSESEWEEVDDCETTSLDNYNPEIPKEGVEITIDCPDLLIKKHKKKKDVNELIRLRINRVRKDIQLSIHKTNLLCLLAHGLYVNKILNCDTIKAFAMSHVPDYIFSLTSGKKVDKLGIPGIEKILSWFHETFSFKNTKCIFQNLFLSLVESFRTGNALNASEFNLMFIVIARILGLKVRFCISFYPVTYKASNLLKKPNSKKSSKKCASNEEAENEEEEMENQESENLKTKKTEYDKNQNESEEKNKTKAAEPPKVKGPKTKKKKNVSETKKKIARTHRSTVKSYKLSSDEEDDDTNDEDFEMNDDYDDLEETKMPRKQNSRKKSISNRQPSRKKLSSDLELSSPNRSSFDSKNIVCWTEIYSKPEKQWIAVECSNNIVNEPYDIEALAPKPVTYILAYDNESHVKDVTRRYCSEYMTSTVKLRVEPEWWEETLEPFLPPNSMQNKAEEKELDEVHVNKPLPTSVQGYKNHPLYALKRHLLKFEAIYPPDAPPVGFFRGEPVYARDCVHQLSSREKWLREARVVRTGEEPYKMVTSPKWDKINRCIITGVPLELFGYWQTEQYEPPVAVGGKVPRNEYGNVELCKTGMLPRGTVHLTLPGINRIAKKLNIDCSPAVVRFRPQNYRPVPVFEGFVICEEFKDTIIAAWEEEQKNARKRAEEKREKRIYANWKKLIRGLIIRERIKLKYDTK